MLKNTQFIIFKLVTYSILNIKICAAITSPMIQDSKSWSWYIIRSSYIYNDTLSIHKTILNISKQDDWTFAAVTFVNLGSIMNA